MLLIPLWEGGLPHQSGNQLQVYPMGTIKTKIHPDQKRKLHLLSDKLKKHALTMSTETKMESPFG